MLFCWSAIYSMVLRGVASALCTAVFFVWGLDDLHDPFRMLVSAIAVCTKWILTAPHPRFHGLSQVFAGIGVYFLWQSVPFDNYKKTDLLPRQTLYAH